ncbi:hypothetical protein Q3G72_005492 [Acer saccharum]|nr:hypothetical protein Q3G72_005492 [Acer saccharum]
MKSMQTTKSLTSPTLLNQESLLLIIPYHALEESMKKSDTTISCLGRIHERINKVKAKDDDEAGDVDDQSKLLLVDAKGNSFFEDGKIVGYDPDYDIWLF